MTEKKFTVKDIEELKKKDPSELKPEEKKYANLNPIKKGEVRNPKGRPKGAVNWSTHFKRLMGDQDFMNTLVKSLPKDWDGVVDNYPASVIAAGLIASATRGVAEAVAKGKTVDESTLKVIDRIEKIGYGNEKKITLDTEEGFFDKVNFNFEVVPDRPKDK